MCRFSQELQIFFFNSFENRRDSDISGQFLDSIDGCFSVLFLCHIVNTFYPHSAGNLTILFTGAVSIVLHNDGEHHCAGYTMRGIIDSTQGMCHGMSDTETYVGESHTGNVLTQSHAFTTFLSISYCATQGLGNDLDCLQVEHIGHLPGCLGGVTFDCMGQCIHTGGSGQTLRHRRHHLGIYHSEKTLFEEISDDYPYLNNTQIRNVLAAFLFTGEDVFKRISDLSGGERGRVSLAKLVLSNANFLILDEPTNHLDIMSKEILEDALNGYEGTILYVSHDRYFINRTAHRILDLTEGQFVSYVGNYDYYLEKHDTVMAAIEASAPQSADADNTAATKAAESEVKLDWKAQKEEQARLRKKENDLKKCEEKIAELESRISEIDTEMSDPAIGTQVAKLQELTKEQAACQEQLEKLYEQWEELAE